MAGDSSFDPLGMVKAMGPQRDPYSWAAMYAEDAAKGQLHAEDMKNRLLIQEMVRAERAKEGALDRQNRMDIANVHEAGAAGRLADRLKVMRETGGSHGGAMLLPPGTMTKDEFTRAKRKGLVKDEDYGSIAIGGQLHRFPLKAASQIKRVGGEAPATGTPAAPAIPADENDDEYP